MSKHTDKVVLNTTCFAEYKKRNLCCDNRECRMWIDSGSDLNCTILAAQDGPKTLQEIGNIFGVTRMRICQIEKTIFSKLFGSKKLV